jgi:hypothetical protein
MPNHVSFITTLGREIFDFRQYEKETIGAAWARFSQLIHTGLDFSIPEHVL